MCGAQVESSALRCGLLGSEDQRAVHKTSAAGASPPTWQGLSASTQRACKLHPTFVMQTLSLQFLLVATLVMGMLHPDIPPQVRL